MRRYEILLPLRHNDGTDVPPEALHSVVDAIRKQFGAVSFETQTIHGVWEHGGIVFRDDLARLFADVPDTDENRRWFVAFKVRLKADFQQLEIWIVSHQIEVL